MDKTLSEITLDLVQENYAAVRAMQYDHLGRKVRVNVTDNRDTYSVPDTVKAMIKYVKPDGNGIFNDCEIVSGHIEFTFDEQMLAASGTCKACIVLMEDETTLSSMTFTLVIENMPLPNKEIESSYEYDTLTHLITHQEENLEKTKAYAENAATSETKAKNYASAAATSESNATSQAEAAATSAAAAKTSQTAAATSEKNAKTSETNAQKQVTLAKAEVTKASGYADTAAKEVEKINGYQATYYDATQEAIVFTSIASTYDSDNKSITLEV